MCQVSLIPLPISSPSLPSSFPPPTIHIHTPSTGKVPQRVVCHMLELPETLQRETQLQVSLCPSPGPVARLCGVAVCRVAGYFSPTLKEPLFISLLAFPFPSSCSKARGEMVSSVFMCVLLVRCIRGGRRGERAEGRGHRADSSGVPGLRHEENYL